MRRRRAAFMALAGLLLATTLIGCAASPAAMPPRGARSTDSPLSPLPSRTTTSAQLASAQIVIRVTPDRRNVRAGDDIPATVRVENRTGSALAFNEGPCNGKVAIGIENAKFPFDPALAAIACSRWLLPATGVEYRGVISTRYGVCGYTSTPTTPRCLPGGVMPPLPAGSYRTAVALVGDGGRVAFVDPLSITLTP